MVQRVKLPLSVVPVRIQRFVFREKVPKRLPRLCQYWLILFHILLYILFQLFFRNHDRTRRAIRPPSPNWVVLFTTVRITSVKVIIRHDQGIEGGHSELIVDHLPKAAWVISLVQDIWSERSHVVLLGVWSLNTLHKTLKGSRCIFTWWRVLMVQWIIELLRFVSDKFRYTFLSCPLIKTNLKLGTQCLQLFKALLDSFCTRAHLHYLQWGSPIRTAFFHVILQWRRPYRCILQAINVWTPFWILFN